MDDSEILKRVRFYLDARRDDYRRVLAEVKSSLQTYQRSPLGKQAVYRVASRGDYQQGNDVIKREREVAEKIKLRWRDDLSISTDGQSQNK